MTSNTSTGKQQLLDQIKADIVTDNVCPNLATQATNLVFGDGNPNADIMFIGEAPGKKEDEQALPFVGSSGKFLNEMLASINLRREEVYITNIVKYRPPNNRDPEPAEKQAFLPYLLRQFAVIQPRLVVTLGRHSMTCFLPNAKISEIHGQPKRVRISYNVYRKSDSVQQPNIAIDLAGGQGGDGVQGANEKRTSRTDSTVSESRKQATQQSAPSNSRISSPAAEQGVTSLVILPLYHPAAALYNGSMRATLQEDFSNIPQILRTIRNET